MKNAAIRSSKTNRTVPALLAVGGSLAALPVSALELGEVTVHSSLGQPLRASIAYALAPNEALSNSCVSIGPAGLGLPGIGPATVSVANGVINLTGASALREPMVSVRLVVNCPYSPNLTREYMMFVDPPTYDAPRAAEAAASQSRAPVTLVQPEPVRASTTQATPRPTPVADIAQGTTIRVPAGATLGELAQRIENRTTSLWPTVNALFEANPHAFIDNDPNKLKAGALLTIPASLGTAVAEATTADIVTIETVDAAASDTVDSTASSQVYEVAEDVTTEEVAAEAPAEQQPVEMTGDLQPGDLIVSDNPYVETEIAETVVIPDTSLEGPTTSSSSPNATTQIITPRADTASASNWAWWAGGAGILAVIALLLFGRRSRAVPEPSQPTTSATTMNRRITDTTTEEVLVVEESEYNPNADYDLDDDSPTEENLVLDADLVTGSGLAGSDDVDVNQDFGYASSQEVDVELPFEPVASDATDETDVLPPPRIDESSILKNEVLPGAEEDDYDMSIIVDATKMPRPEEVTERDLKAIEVRPDETMIAENYTINREVDYEILEQDYEDELTATQALNEEIARAAAELAERMDDDDADESGETAVLPMASVTELDVTAEMPAANSDEVVELDKTAEMALDSDEDDDATAEMQIESGKSG